MPNALNYSWFDALSVYRHRQIQPLTTRVADMDENGFRAVNPLVACLMAHGMVDRTTPRADLLDIAAAQFGRRFTLGFLDGLTGVPYDGILRGDVEYDDGVACGTQARLRIERMTGQPALPI